MTSTGSVVTTKRSLTGSVAYIHRPSLVSVIIPNFNNARYLADAIESALEQTYRNFEIIVVDDGSTDNSRTVVARFGDQIHYVWQENKGLAGARNTGIRHAQGELIGLLDADDKWLPDFLATMVALAGEYPGAAVYYSCARGMNEEGRELPRLFGRPAGPPNAMYDTLLRANFLIPSTIVLRRSIVNQVGLFDENVREIHGCEDWDLWLRIASDHDFAGTSSCLVNYRLHDGTFSANPAHMQKAARAVIAKHFGPDDGSKDTWSTEKRRAYGGVYRYCALTSVQRQNDWRAGAQFLRLALQVDPTLAVDLDFFYDLALGSQPPGLRGTPFQLNLENNASYIGRLLTDVFASPLTSESEALRRKTYASAYSALGLVAYNSGKLFLSRRFLLAGLRLRLDLSRDPRIVGTLFRSLIGRSGIDLLRQVRRTLRNMSQT